METTTESSEAERIYIQTRYPQIAGTDGPWVPNTDLAQDLYATKHKGPRGYLPLTLLSGLWKPRKRLQIVRRECPGWTMADHGIMAQAHLRAAEDCARLWLAVANAASLKLWGRAYDPTDYKVSGIVTARFTLTEQTILRELSSRETDHNNAASMHKYAGRYSPRESEAQ